MYALALQADQRQNEILDLLHSWLSGVKGRVSDKIVSCYSKNAALWGSLTKRLRCDEEGIRRYFEEFLTADKHDLKVRFDQMEMNEIAGLPVVSGVYVFTWKDSEGNLVALPARYTFVLSKRNGKWKIEDHHATVLPN
ncbi:DUF4440 domain-containing protein [Phaeocystidibacter luteus]|uniref:DUF4440 domain-containing protein n=1 Tax=Phaeocystidibacter luteus TaxID=911197 RepID=A0A6N6RFA2_9FLAO|nr:DUF4440 domain-containing protein [Phaeocystidibacter luteus]KAB2806834.1 DUF4440 domain-containing protein [Phaeocystidibacter luteus]